MTNTPILNLPQVASNQNQKETTINSALAILEAAMNDAESISLASGDRTLTTDQFTKFFHQKYSGQTADRQVTIPNTVRWFAVSNLGAHNVTIKANGSLGLTSVVGPSARALLLSDGVDVVMITQGVSNLSDLSDTSGLASASAGQIVGWDGGVSKWVAVDNPSDAEFFIIGKPGAGAKVYRRSFNRSALFFSDFTGSHVSADTAATGSSVFTVKRNGTTVGTLTFAASGTTATFSTNVGSGSVPLTFNAGDVMEITAPGSQDATLADISFALKGVFLA